jgi:hypothetical protein
MNFEITGSSSSPYQNYALTHITSIATMAHIMTWFEEFWTYKAVTFDRGCY